MNAVITCRELLENSIFGYLNRISLSRHSRGPGTGPEGKGGWKSHSSGIVAQPIASSAASNSMGSETTLPVSSGEPNTATYTREGITIRLQESKRGRFPVLILINPLWRDCTLRTVLRVQEGKL